MAYDLPTIPESFVQAGFVSDSNMAAFEKRVEEDRAVQRSAEHPLLKQLHQAVREEILNPLEDAFELRGSRRLA